MLSCFYAAFLAKRRQVRDEKHRQVLAQSSTSPFAHESPLVFFSSLLLFTFMFPCERSRLAQKVTLLMRYMVTDLIAKNEV